jgi:hypothetical protein
VKVALKCVKMGYLELMGRFLEAVLRCGLPCVFRVTRLIQRITIKVVSAVAFNPTCHQPNHSITANSITDTIIPYSARHPHSPSQTHPRVREVRIKMHPRLPLILGDQEMKIEAVVVDARLRSLRRRR